MATTAAPYGLRAVNLIGGQPYAGSTRAFLIDPAGYNTNIFNGSVVYVNGSGYINIVTATGADATTNVWPAGSSSFTGAVGVFTGCSYVNAQGQQIWSQYYPANTTGVVTAYVIDDPDVIFQCQADSAVAQAELGANTYFAAAQSTSTGSTTTGNSTSAVTGTTITTTAAFRVVGFVSTPGDTYTDILVKINPGWHSYSQAVGI